ncbi:kinase-like domain-containing protein [Cladochytrium replicatum]|nr:kinase-like domain-containing protein [Cladochytrium replicatum]
MSLAPCEYRTGRTLGQGSYATVKEAVHVKTGERVAVKVISKKLMTGREHMIQNEIEILRRVSKGHPNIVTLHDYFATPNNLYLVMDLCTGGELFDRIVEKGSFYEKDAAHIVRIVCDAVAYLHDQNIVHRDIKPENLLFRERDSFDDIVIADFGLSKIMDPETYDGLMTTCGTPGYMAPEVIRKTGHGKSVDMWSIGVLAYFLLCGYMPFDAQSQADELQNILNGNYKFEPIDFWYDVSDAAKEFISKLLIVDPKVRMSAHQALQHPWLQADDHGGRDLLLSAQRNFSARQRFRRAVDMVRAVQRVSHISNPPVSPSAEQQLAEYRPTEDMMTDDGQVLVLPRA